MKRIIPINKEPGYEWDVYGNGAYILILQEDLKSWLPKTTFDNQFFKVQDNVIIPKSDTLKTSIKSNIEIDTEQGDENTFLNKKGEFVTPITKHKDLIEKNEEANFQHVTQEEKDLILSAATTVNVTHDELLDLISNNKLIPNSSYRITDYTTTTVQANTTSAGHDFDIIVTALSTNKLSEIASCVRKSGDTYFTNAKLEAWEIKYCINNDRGRFAWANTANGKGVIYYMKDEWGNECPYDFKNIKFKKLGVFLYTFGGTTDNSLTGGCRHNTIMDDKTGSTLRLNFNTFGNYCNSNTFGINCYNNKFGDYCNHNTFGDSCASNTFGNNCSSNTFDMLCSSNTFGNECDSNKFGNNCSTNTFGNKCKNNTFGTDCSNNAFGDWCLSNTFGCSCSSNTFDMLCISNIFGAWCQSNTFGGGDESNTFGTNCSNNTFGPNCNYNTFGNWSKSSTFGNNCSNNTFGNQCDSNKFGNDCSSNNFYTGTTGVTKKNFIRYLVLEDGCTYNNFYSSTTTGSSAYLQRIRIKGLQNASATNTQITLSATNTKYEWVICYTSSGVLKQYCPDEEINNLLPLIYAGL